MKRIWILMACLLLIGCSTAEPQGSGEQNVGSEQETLNVENDESQSDVVIPSEEVDDEQSEDILLDTNFELGGENNE